MHKNIDAAVKEIVEGYFEGKKLTELIQSPESNTTISRFETQIKNFKG